MKRQHRAARTLLTIAVAAAAAHHLRRTARPADQKHPPTAAAAADVPANTVTDQPQQGGASKHLKLRAPFIFLITIAILAVTGLLAMIIILRPPAPIIVDATATSPQAWSQTVAQAATPAIGRVSVGKTGSGTAFFYRENRMATAAHVIASDPPTLTAALTGKKPPVTIDMADGHHINGTVVTVDSRLDVAVIDAAIPQGTHPLALSTTPPPQGAPVMTAGASFAAQTVVGVGVVSGILTGSEFATNPAQTVLISIDATVNPGMSGGPLLTTQGTVAGIVVSRPDNVNGRPAANTAIAVPSALIEPMLASAKPGSKTDHPVVGIAGKPDAGVGGIVIADVSANSPAEKAGLRQGNIILTVNGQSALNPAVLGLAVATGKPVTVQVGSDGHTRTVTLDPVDRNS